MSLQNLHDSNLIYFIYAQPAPLYKLCLFCSHLSELFTLSVVFYLNIIASSSHFFRHRTYDNTNLEELAQVCKEYYDRMFQCESQKYDMEFECRKKDFEVWVELLFSTLGWIQVSNRDPHQSSAYSSAPLSFKSSLFGWLIVLF